MNTKTIFLASISALLLLIPIANAGNVTIPNNFTSGTPAVAADVNANFSAMETEVDDNDNRISNNTNNVATNTNDIATLQSTITSLQNTITSLQNQLTAVQSNSVLALDGYLILDTDTYGYQRALFSGVNVQVVNGVGQTTITGLGNLIVGYNTARDAGGFVCSDGQYTDITSCGNNGGVWLRSHKSGSHNIVAGDGNSYSQHGGVIFGSDNVINGAINGVNSAING